MPAVSPTPTAGEIDKQEAFPWNYGSLLQTGLVDEATGDEGFNSTRGGRRRTACSVTEHSTAQQPGERAHTHSRTHTHPHCTRKKRALHSHRRLRSAVNNTCSSGRLSKIAPQSALPPPLFSRYNSTVAASSNSTRGVSTFQ